jgi:hypothetical protein
MPLTCKKAAGFFPQSQMALLLPQKRKSLIIQGNYGKIINEVRMKYAFLQCK